MKVWWYLSFADNDGFKGGVHVEVEEKDNRQHEMIAAVREAHRRQINPGGEVRGLRLTDAKAHELPPPKWRNRLMSKSDLQAVFGETVKWPK